MIDDDDDDAVAAPRAGQAFAGLVSPRVSSSARQQAQGGRKERCGSYCLRSFLIRSPVSVSSSETREGRFWPGSGSPSSAESRDPPELGPAELDAGSAAALTAFVASPAWRCSSVKIPRRRSGHDAGHEPGVCPRAGQAVVGRGCAAVRGPGCTCDVAVGRLMMVR